jgi:nucleotide-binding universal stress UspA family protein
MLEIRQILVPCDFSDSSRQALDRAATLARWYDAEITLLHVVPLWPTMSEFPPYVNPISLETTTHDQLARELKGFAEPVVQAWVDVHYLVRNGDPTDTILTVADEIGSDLVVMGTHGRRGFDRWAVGSVTEKVLRRSACPVLAIRLGADVPIPAGVAPFKRIVCGLDFSKVSREALDYALALAEEADAQLTLVHVVEWQHATDALLAPEAGGPNYQEYVERIARQEIDKAVPAAARDWCRLEKLVVAGKAHAEILRIAEERKAQLIVLGIHGASALNVMLFGSTARHVVRDAPCPVLTVRSSWAGEGRNAHDRIRRRAAQPRKTPQGSPLVPS